MASIEPLEYVRKMQEAYQKNDKEAVEELQKKYADNPVTLGDVEDIVAYVFNASFLLATAYRAQDNAHFFMLMKAIKETALLTPTQIDEIMQKELKIQTEIDKRASEGLSLQALTEIAKKTVGE